jgi:carbamate kinase
MGPKIEAALEFLQAGGRRAIVTSPERIVASLRGEAGTEILPPVRTVPEHIAAA